MDPQIEITLPERVPLMIFPAALIFPHTIQPLRIFEHRYRAMLTWALEAERMFCLTQLRPGSTDSFSPDDFYHIAGLGLIRASIGQEDGTSHLLLQGLARVQCTDFIQEDSFWTASISLVRDHGHTDAEIGSLVDEVRLLGVACAARTGGVPPEFSQHLNRLRDPGILADAIANAVLADHNRRRELLEEPHVGERLRKLRDFLKSDLAF
jgi:ATP-dependent Lon protease